MAALLLPVAHPHPYHLDILATAGLYVLLALGRNVVVGFTGLLHLGYAAFFAIGAYTYGLLNLRLGWPFWVGLPPAVAVAGLCGVLLGIPALRVRGDYLAIVTLGFGEIVRITVTNLEPWTGGPNGLVGIAHPTVAIPWRGTYDFGVDSAPYYYVVLLAVLILAGACRRMSRSRVGRACRRRGGRAALAGASASSGSSRPRRPACGTARTRAAAPAACPAPAPR